MSLILYVDRIKEKNLQALLKGESLLVVVKSFFCKRHCAILRKKIFDTLRLGYYTNAPEIARIGKAYFETVDCYEGREKYFALQGEWIRQLRSCCAPYVSPIDMLRVTLDDVWKCGAHLACMDGKKMFVGLVRYFKKHASAEPHQDILYRDAPTTDLGGKIKKQLACNLYLKTPSKKGGESWKYGIGSLQRRNLKRYKIPERR